MHHLLISDICKHFTLFSRAHAQILQNFPDEAYKIHVVQRTFKRVKTNYNMYASSQRLLHTAGVTMTWTDLISLCRSSTECMADYLRVCKCENNLAVSCHFFSSSSFSVQNTLLALHLFTVAEIRVSGNV